MCACGWLIHNTCIIEIMIFTPFHCSSRIFPTLPLSMEMTETPILAPCIMQVVVHLDLIWFVNDRLWYTKPCEFWIGRMPEALGPIFGPKWPLKDSQGPTGLRKERPAWNWWMTTEKWWVGAGEKTMRWVAMKVDDWGVAMPDWQMSKMNISKENIFIDRHIFFEMIRVTFIEMRCDEW